MTRTVLFAEHSRRLRADVQPDGETTADWTTVRGMCVERHHGDRESFECACH